MAVFINGGMPNRPFFFNFFRIKRNVTLKPMPMCPPLRPNWCCLLLDGTTHTIKILWVWLMFGPSAIATHCKNALTLQVLVRKDEPIKP